MVVLKSDREVQILRKANLIVFEVLELLESIASDMARIAAGVPMPALGEGKACEFCAARGMCRKDFWELG